MHQSMRHLRGRLHEIFGLVTFLLELPPHGASSVPSSFTSMARPARLAQNAFVPQPPALQGLFSAGHDKEPAAIEGRVRYADLMHDIKGAEPPEG